MKILHRFFLLTSLVFVLTSAIAVNPKADPAPAAGMAVSAVSASKTTLIQKFFKLFSQDKQDEDKTKADKHAGTSLILGISAFGVLLLGMFVPYVALLSIPLGIVAMTTGASALRKGTNREGAARTGRGLGMGAIITFAALVLLAVILLASWDLF
jgi:hypothetical protein